MRGTSSSSAAAQTFSVETSAPATASTTTSAASATRSAARASLRKLRHPRRVDEVDLVLVPLGVGEAAGEGVLAGDLFFVVVGDRRAVVHAPEAVDGAGVEEQRRNQLRLPGAGMTDQRDVSDAGGIVDLHRNSPPESSRAVRMRLHGVENAILLRRRPRDKCGGGLRNRRRNRLIGRSGDRLIGSADRLIASINRSHRIGIGSIDRSVDQPMSVDPLAIDQPIDQPSGDQPMQSDQPMPSADADARAAYS